jgi:hypothetical protein
LQPNNAVLADINYDLIRTYLAVRDHPQAVSNRLVPKSLLENAATISSANSGWLIWMLLMQLRDSFS